MKNLQLPLKTKWFEMTKDGIKIEDYRDLNEYWAKRLGGVWEWVGDKKGLFPEFKNSFMSSHKILSFKNYNHNIMTSDYPKSTDTDRILIFEHKGIEIRTGNPEWGAEPGKLYFVIKHGKLINKII